MQLSMLDGATGRVCRRITVLALLLACALAPGVRPARAGAALEVCPSGCPFASIQAAVNAASPGDAINVAAGVYAEAITIAKNNLFLTGAGASSTLIVGPKSGGADTVLVSSSGNTLDGFTITREGNTPADWAANTRMQGVNFSGAGNTLQHSIVVGNRTGVLLAASGNWLLSNTIDNNRLGVQISGGAKDHMIRQNHIAGNWTSGILFRQDNSAGDTTSIRDNLISGNWYSQIEDRGNPAGATRDLRANSFGAPSYTTLIQNTSGEPAYAAQIPATFGGTAVAPASAPTFVVNRQDPNPNGDSGGRGNAKTSRLAFSPWLTSGANSVAAGAPGFAGDFGRLSVGATGVPVGTSGPIQSAVDTVNAGGTVLVATGAYTENVTISRALMLAGAGQDATVLRPAISNPNCAGQGGGSLCPGASSLILVQADNVSIHDLTLDGDNPALASGYLLGDADVDARNGIVTNHNIVDTFDNLSVHDVTVRNIYLRGVYASTGGSFSFDRNTVQNVQGDGAAIGIFNLGGAGTISNNSVADAHDAIAADQSRGVQFLDNTISASATGIHTDNAGQNGGSGDLIQGNHVSNCTVNGQGIRVVAPYLAPVVQQNSVSGCDIGLAAYGQGAPAAASFSANLIDGAGHFDSVGVWVATDRLGAGPSNVAAALSNNSFTNLSTTLVLEAQAGYTLVVSATQNAFNTNAQASITQFGGGTHRIGAARNWWGSPSGPAAPSNPGGAGVALPSGVSFEPWLCDGADSAPAIGFQPNATKICNATPPDTQIAERPADPNTKPTVRFGFTGSDDVTPPSYLTFECQVDGAPFAACASPQNLTTLDVGPHSFSVRAKDPAGRPDPTPATYSWVQTVQATPQTLVYLPVMRSAP